MSGSMKDAFQKSGLVQPEATPEKPSTKKPAWRDELPEDDGKPHVPFDAPAVTKAKPSKP